MHLRLSDLKQANKIKKSTRSYQSLAQKSKLSLMVLLMGSGLAGCASKTTPEVPPQKLENATEVPAVETSKTENATPMNSVQSASNEKMESKGIDAYKLPNGLQIYLIDKKAIPMATVLIAVKNGSFAETESNNGLAHLYEHMFFKANEKIPAQSEFLRALDEMGIELGPNMNAYTSTESVRYFFTLQTEYLKRGLEFMADAVKTPKFLQDELEKERKVVIGEFDRYEASPTDVFFRRSLFSKLYGDTFIRKNVIGTRPVILSASQDQMHEIQHRYYIPNNAALFVVGEFDPQLVKKTIASAFSDWKSGDDPFVKYPVPEDKPLEKSTTYVEEAPVQTVEVVQAFHGPSMTKDDPGVMAFDLVSLMLGLESSLFQKELVESGLSSHATFFSWSQRYTSPLVFNLETTPENAVKAKEALMNLVKRLQAGKFFSDRDLEIAKNSVEVSTAFERESGQRFALNLGSVWTSTGTLSYQLDYVENMKKISLADIDREMKTYFARPYILGALVPTGQNTFGIPSSAASGVKK